MNIEQDIKTMVGDAVLILAVCHINSDQTSERHIGWSNVVAGEKAMLT
jgi:hypothetical protein